MAVSTSTYFSNSINGVPAVAADVDFFKADSTPRFAIGHRICRQDGNEYVYGHFGADTSRGLLLSTDVSESCNADADNVIVAPASAQTTTDGTAGYKFVEITLAGVTADQFAGGYLVITDDTGEGYTYRVKGNTATDDPASGNIRVELYDKLQASLDATSDFAIQGNLYANLEGATAGTDSCVSGVSVVTMDVSEAAYGWIQTKGVVGVLQDGTIAIGDNVTLSDGVAGAVQLKDAETETIVGSCLIAGDDTGHGVFRINL